jgi:hypothetical protein
MSNPHLPAEMLDRVVDHLHDTKDALRNCCLVSKSWTPRTRTHLFADIRFATAESLQSWEETFPDPSTSPAHYTKTLSVTCPEAVTAAETSGWIRGFSRVVHLEIGSNGSFSEASARALSFAPFHGFSPVIKSFRVVIPAPSFPRVFNLICSFPLLEDLDVVDLDPLFGIPINSNNGSDGLPATTKPQNLPVFTGAFKLLLWTGMEPFTRRLLSLPSGIHFRKLTLTWSREEDLSLMVALVEGCSHTIESLDITCNLLGKLIWRFRSRKIT